MLSCWRRREFDPGADFGLTHHHMPLSRTQQRFQRHRSGSLEIGGLGQPDVGANRRNSAAYRPQQPDELAEQKQLLAQTLERIEALPAGLRDVI